MKKLLTLFILFSFVQVNAQICPGFKIQSKPQPVTTFSGCGTNTFTGKHIVKSTAFVSEKRSSYLYVPQKYTSFVIGYFEDSVDVKIVVGKDTFQLDKDEHYMRRKTHHSILSTRYQSNLIIPTEPSDTIFFIANGKRLGLATIYFINVPKLGKNITSPQPTRLKRADCEEPATVSYTVWRDGLDPPVPGREATQVEHCIVHHSATSNAQTNYTEVMRNIYVYHTEINGWDDIGYNYVVAPNGTIFLGRDPQGVADHDNILGAHFCAKNSNTMGICMMGTFTDVAPTDTALTALENLLTWKMNKEHLYPFGESVHPHGVGSMLGNLAGHRDGCATECPGTQTYNLLGSIKQNVLNNLYNCGTFVSVDNIDTESGVSIYPNPSNGVFTIKGLAVGTSYLVLNTLGQSVLTGTITQAESQLTLPTGLYFFTTADGYTKKLVVQ